MDAAESSSAMLKVPLLKAAEPVGATVHASMAAPEVQSMQASPSYDVLDNAGLLTRKYLKEDLGDLDLLHPNTTEWENMWLRIRCCCMPPLIGLCLYPLLYSEAQVYPGYVLKLIDDEGNFHLAGPGLYNIGFWRNGSWESTFWKFVGKPVPLKGHINHGDKNILIVNQGLVGLAWDRGTPVLFPPGLHEWTSHTLKFSELIDLGQPAIPIGPYTLLTVDDGYAAITEDNGKQIILTGGQTHFLSHRNWKFTKFLSKKIQTDNLESIHATSADNIIMEVTSTVNWRIVDVETAALVAADTMVENPSTMSADITKLREDVLKQAIASLATFIGSVNYSDSFHLAAAAQSATFSAVGVPASSTKSEEDSTQDNPLFNKVRMKTAVEHANDVTQLYGVHVLSINIISADPVDTNLRRALASGAVAAAEALQAETAARGNSKAVKIETQTNAENLKIEAEANAGATKIKAAGEAEAEIIKARADAEAERLRAAGAKDAADTIASSQVAVDLAKMDKAGAAIGSNAKYFFGEDPKYMSSLLLKGAI